MQLELSTQLVGRLLRLMPGASIASMDLPAIQARRAKGIPRNAVTTPVIGVPSRRAVWHDRELSTDGGPIPVRVYRPDDDFRDLPVVVHFHGGGWVLGDLESGDWLCSHLAVRGRVVVVSVDYALAPEHPFPTAVTQCVAATRWIAEHAAEIGGDGRRLAVMGDSAGGNLAAVVALAARDAGGPDISLQVLIYPGTDATLSSPSVHRLADAPFLSRDDIEAFLHHYVGAGDRTDPRVSPLLAPRHDGLPPALVQAAEHDPLLDDARRYARVLRDAEVPVRETVYLGAPHGYVNLSGISRPAWQALAEIVTEVRERLHVRG